jgi:hypothetical protein
MAGLFPPFGRFERFSVFVYFGSKGFRIFLIFMYPKGFCIFRVLIQKLFVSLDPEVFVFILTRHHHHILFIVSTIHRDC